MMSNLWVQRRKLLLLFLNDGQVNVMVLGLASNSKTPSLHVGEDDPDQLSE
jgi:hypothetical protein